MFSQACVTLYIIWLRNKGCSHWLEWVVDFVVPFANNVKIDINGLK